MNKSELKAYHWLSNQQLEPLADGRDGRPDFKTKDGHGYEVKLLYNNMIIFTPSQMNFTQTHPDRIDILIFDANSITPIKIVPARLITDGGHVDGIRIHVISNPLRLRIEPELMKAIGHQAIREGRRVCELIEDALHDYLNKGGQM